MLPFGHEYDSASICTNNIILRRIYLLEVTYTALVSMKKFFHHHFEDNAYNILGPSNVSPKTYR